MEAAAEALDAVFIEFAFAIQRLPRRWRECRVPHRPVMRAKLLTVGLLITHASSARAAVRGLGSANQGAQGRIDGLLVGEIGSDVRRKKHEIRSGAARFAAPQEEKGVLEDALREFKL